MKVMPRRKKMDAVVIWLSVMGMCLNPVVAGQDRPSLRPPEIQRAQASEPDKVVKLGPDGSFKAVVRTVEGQLVGNAQVTFIPMQPDAEPLQFAIGNRGEAQVMGVKPAMYNVRVDAGQFSYEGTLQVSDSKSVPAHTPQLVVFTVRLNQAPEELAPEANQSAAGEGRLARGSAGRTALGLALAGAVATAIAVPLIVASSRSGHSRPNPVASP